MSDWSIPWIDFLKWQFVLERAYEPGDGYQWVKNETAPLTPMKKPLNECRVTFWSQYTVRTKDQEVWEKEITGEWLKDVSWKEIPRDVDVNDLIYVADWNPDAEADRNLAFPLDRFRELEKNGFIGDLAPVVFSSHPTFRRSTLVHKMGPEAVKRLKELKIDAIVLMAM